MSGGTPCHTAVALTCGERHPNTAACCGFPFAAAFVSTLHRKMTCRVFAASPRLVTVRFSVTVFVL